LTAKFLVLGANSFSGSTFCDYVAEQGHDVIATSRSAQPNRAFLPYTWQERPGKVRFYQVDINQDLDRLKEIMEAERATHVINFAAQSMVGESWEHPDHWMMTNVVSTVRLHEMLRKLDFLDCYLHVTTPEVYGSTEGWVKEDHSFDPSTPYAVSRAAADMSLKTYRKQYDFPVVATRAANVYGPGQQLYRIVPRTILFALTGQTLQLHGGGVSTRSFIHMRDVCDATYRVAMRGRVGHTYHISTNELVSIKDLVTRIFTRMDVDPNEQIEVVGERPGKDTSYKLDSTKIREELGWQDTISLDQGIEDTIGWAESFKDTLTSVNPNYVHKP
jgi:dTDP-glucose 4,6-dehydratase